MMSFSNIAPGIFESFNARFRPPEDVARTFVISDHFNKLSKRSHSLVVGPRGSGKTTLLKMLQVQALSDWKHQGADDYRARIDYTGVFIPTDIIWAKEIKNLGENYLSTDQHQLLANSVFTTHILKELIATIQFRLITSKTNNKHVHRGVSCTTEQEIDFVKAISLAWGVKPDIYSVISLKQAMTKRSAEIFEIASRERFLDKSNRNERFSNINFLHINFLQAIVAAIEIFADIFGDASQRWALMFDELELAPNDIVKHLISSLRSSDQRIFFKLSFSPFNENIDLLHDALAAMPGHDFEYIQLWYPNKDDGVSFSKELVRSMIKERKLDKVSIEQILGQPIYEMDDNIQAKHVGKYTANSKQVKIFERMFSNDRTFRDYIISNRINLRALDQLKEKERAISVRKIYPIVLVRDAYRSPDKIPSSSYQHYYQPRRRSRKAYPEIYAGAKTILEILEGNPRWIIGVLSSLLDEYSRDKKTITPSRQLEEIKKAANQFKSLLGALPCDVTREGDPPKSIMKILDMIGDNFKKAVILDKFQPEPVGSFIVDRRTTKEFEKSLSLALNAGAIVYCPGTTSQLIIKSLIDRRFRLSFLLAPYYNLPIQLMRETHLSQILTGNRVKQLSLFYNDAKEKD